MPARSRARWAPVAERRGPMAGRLRSLCGWARCRRRPLLGGWRGGGRAPGPGGRVTGDDVRAASGETEPRTAPDPAAEPAPPAEPLRPLSAVPVLPRFEQWGPVERQPLSHLRRTIAENMTLSAT